MAQQGAPWRVIAATVAFLLWAPLALASLPLAVLLMGRGARGGPLVGITVAVFSAATLPFLGQGQLGAVYAAVCVLLAAAFAGHVLLKAAPFWTMAVRATATALASVAILARVLWGPGWLGALQWETTQQARAGTRVLVWVMPDARPVFDAVADVVGTIAPATLALQCLAALALAWAVHGRLATQPLGAPLRPFREFRMGDAWVWVVVATFGVWLLGRAALAQNLAMLVGTLYFLQGAAVAGALAGALGISTGVLVVIGILAAPFAAILIPGLCTLGVTDTWLQYRRRLAARADRPHG